MQPYEQRRVLPTNVTRLNEYKNDIVITYNDYVGYLADEYAFLTKTQQEIFDIHASELQKLLKRAFSILNLQYNFLDSVYAQIDISQLTSIDTAANQGPSTSDSDRVNTPEPTKSTDSETNTPAVDSDSDGETDPKGAVGGDPKGLTHSSPLGSTESLVLQDLSLAETEELEQKTEQKTEQQFEQQEEEQIERNPRVEQPIIHQNIPIVQPVQIPMAQTEEQFLNAAKAIMTGKYGGDPLKLNGFIRDATMVEKLAKNEDVKKFCLEYIKSRLEGRAEECIPDDCDSVAKLTAALKEKIKPDSSTVIEGKMLALRLIKGDFTKFAKEAEELSEAFRRSLTVEGITKAKAEEMAIRKTVEVCRKTARAEVVKSVLEATQYSTPAEVVATFITQSDKARREFKDEQNLKQKKSGNSSGNGNNNRNKHFHKNRNSRDNRGGNRNDNRSGARNGRGQGQQNQQNRGRYNGNRSSGNEHTIRFVTGAPPAATADQPQQEQFFQLQN